MSLFLETWVIASEKGFSWIKSNPNAPWKTFSIIARSSYLHSVIVITLRQNHEAKLQSHNLIMSVPIQVYLLVFSPPRNSSLDAAPPDLGDFSVRRVLSPERGVESEAGQSINIPEQRVESRVACEQSPGSHSSAWSQQPTSQPPPASSPRDWRRSSSSMRSVGEL